MKRYKENFIIIFLTLLLFVLNFIWLKIDTRSPHFDFAIHLTNSLRYFEFLKGRQFLNFFLDYFYYPPLAYYLTSLSHLFFGINEDIGVLSLTPFLLILFLFTYKLGELTKGKTAGVLTIFILAGIPFLISQTREYQPDFPLTAAFVLNLYLFFKSKFLQNQRWTLFFGLSSSLALLTKSTYIIFLTPMIVVSLISGLKRNILPIFIKNFFLFLSIVLLIAGPWYISNLSNLKRSLSQNIAIAKAEGDPTIFSFDSLVWYFRSLYQDYLLFPWLIFFLIGAFYLILKRQKLNKIYLILAISIVYFLMMTFYINKDPRFIEPLTPVFAILIAY